MKRSLFALLNSYFSDNLPGWCLWLSDKIMSGETGNKMETSKSDDRCKCRGGKMKDGQCVLPPVTFSSFLMSLNTSALYHLGEINDPVTGKQEKDLLLAKHSIDTLQVLKEKTKGNLNSEEDNLLSNILYDLQMHYVKANAG